MRRARASAAASLAMAAVFCAGPIAAVGPGAGDPNEPTAVDRDRPAAAAPRNPFWRTLVREHAWHIAAVAGASLANSTIDNNGPRSSPLFFDDPPSLDETIRGRYRRGPGDTGSHGFVEHHVTSLTRAVAAGAIFASNASRWRDDVEDYLGLWEAQRFNIATTGIVKNLVGRERPRLELAASDGATPAEIARLDRSDSNHQSFYSYHASTTFTTLSYADLVISRRLSSHPAARRWTRAGLYALGSYIAWSRVLQDGHYFSDVVAGSFAGIYVGRSFYAFNHHDGVDRWFSIDPRPHARVTSGPRPHRGVTLGPPILLPDGVMVFARVSL